MKETKKAHDSQVRKTTINKILIQALFKSNTATQSNKRKNPEPAKKIGNEDHRETSPQRLLGIFKIIDLKEEYPENTKSWTYEN